MCVCVCVCLGAVYKLTHVRDGDRKNANNSASVRESLQPTQNGSTRQLHGDFSGCRGRMKFESKSDVAFKCCKTPKKKKCEEVTLSSSNVMLTFRNYGKLIEGNV